MYMLIVLMIESILKTIDSVKSETYPLKKFLSASASSSLSSLITSAGNTA